MKKKLKGIFIVILIYIVLLIGSYIYIRNPYILIVYGNCTTYGNATSVGMYKVKIVNDFVNNSLSDEEYNLVIKNAKKLKKKLKDYETINDICIPYIKIGFKKYSLESIAKDEEIKELLEVIYYTLKK